MVKLFINCATRYIHKRLINIYIACYDECSYYNCSMETTTYEAMNNFAYTMLHRLFTNTLSFA